MTYILSLFLCINLSSFIDGLKVHINCRDSFLCQYLMGTDLLCDSDQILKVLCPASCSSCEKTAGRRLDTLNRNSIPGKKMIILKLKVDSEQNGFL